MWSKQQNKIIAEYWFRILIDLDFSSENISDIIAQFADEFELFDKLMTGSRLLLNEDFTEVSFSSDVISRISPPSSTFGTILAISGRKYHWRLEILSDSNANIGIIEASKCEKSLDNYWWGENWGYSYYKDGELYHEDCDGEYGESFGNKGDIIDVYLDFKDKNELSFGKDDTKFDTAYDIDSSKDYKLGIGLYSGSIRLLFVKISY